MKKLFVMMYAAALFACLPIAAQAQTGTPFSATIELTDFYGGTFTQHGEHMLFIRDLTVVGVVTGDVQGDDVHNYNANLNMEQGKGHTFGTQTIQATSPCNGTLEGSFHGTTQNGDFADQDNGKFTLTGVGGCAGYELKGSYTEPADGVFILEGVMKYKP